MNGAEELHSYLQPISKVKVGVDPCDLTLPSQAGTTGEKVSDRLHILATPFTRWVDFSAEPVLIRAKGDVVRGEGVEGFGHAETHKQRRGCGGCDRE